MVSSTQHTLRLAVRLLVSSLLVSGVSQADMSAATAAALDTAIRSDARTDDDRARDSDRLPKETLAFFGFERNMTVVEIFPGAGWYSKLLIPTLAEKGQYVAVGGLTKVFNHGDDLAGLNTLPGYDKIKFVDLSPVLSHSPYWGVVDMKPKDFGIRNADLVLTFRNLHNLSPDARAAMYTASYNALKKGGRFGVIDHTRRHMQEQSREIWRRMDPVLIIKEATAAGLTLIDYSNLHHRPDDELRYEVGRRSVTGNTDRFTLLFEKR